MKPLPKLIFWDWNGTLLNDTGVCVQAMNDMLSKRKMPTIEEGYYKSVFGFPVKHYYQHLGFRFEQENFEDLSVEFIENYQQHFHRASIQPYTVETLTHFKNKGVRQVIVSAMEQGMLNKQVEEAKLNVFFEEVLGIQNIFAESKTHLALEFLANNSIESESMLFVGDTLHDKEVSDALGIQAVLVSNGHQSASRLRVNGNLVINNLKSLLDIR
ncbi:MAG: HAD family hydrolase [Bacteroidota bacterium]|nr:MAG: HAD family hydrolase [Bacteroidota bacterium]